MKPLFFLILSWTATTFATGNEGGHGGDPVVRDFAEGWRLALKMVREVRIESFDIDNAKDEEALTWFIENREEYDKDIEFSPSRWVEFRPQYTLCGYTGSDRYSPNYLSKTNCKGQTIQQAAEHFLNESVHHFNRGDFFSALVTNAIKRAYAKEENPAPGKINPRVWELKLIHEARLGNYEEVRDLLEGPHKVNPNSKDSRGTTALIWAVASPGANYRAVELLIKHGAYVDTKNEDLYTAFDFIYGRNKKDPAFPDLIRIARLLVPRSAQKIQEGEKSLVWLSRENEPEGVKAFLELSPSPKAISQAWSTALDGKSNEALRVLLPLIQEEAEKDRGLRYAITQKNQSLLEALLKAGANVEYQANATQETPLFTALDNVPAIQALIGYKSTLR